MFNKKRPAPSPAALRVLAQLAYISSGTALGAAALCAEERRRRIKIVQKLADNARVIRQHPRHVSNVAIAVNDNGDSGLEGFFGGGGWSPEAVRRKSRRIRGGHSELSRTEHEGVKGPALPSVVEEGYAETVARADRGQEDGGVRAASSSANKAFGVGYGARDRAKYGNEHSDPADPDSRLSSEYGIPHWRIKPAAKQTKTNYGNIIFRSTRTESRDDRTHDPVRKRARPNKAVTWDSKGTGAAYETAFAWRRGKGLPADLSEPDSASSTVSPDSVIRDIERFFAREARSTATDESISVRANANYQLLILALQKGSMDDVRSLYLWSQTNETFGEQYSFVLAKSYAILAARTSQEDLLDFYANLFASDAYRNIKRRERLHHQLLVLSGVASSAPDTALKDLAIRLMGSTKQVQTADEVLYCLESTCRSLMKDGKAALAAGFLRTFYRRRAMFFDAFPPVQALFTLADDIVDSCIESGQLVAAGHVLRWRHGRSSAALSREDIVRLQEFINACSVREANANLLDVFFLGNMGKQGMQIPVEVLVQHLDEKYRIVLARACSQYPRYRESFNALYNSLSRESQQSFNENSSVAAIFATWQSNRDLSGVEAEAAVLKDWLGQQKDEQTMKKVDEAMLEIYITAGKTDQALDLISRMRKVDGIDGRTWSLAALLFAKRRGWEHLARLLRIAEFNKPTRIDFEFMRIWDKVILLYSEHHSAEQTLKLVSDSVSSVGFAPTTMTGRVLLQSCVNNRTLEVIPRCLDYLQSIGHQIHLTSRVVAGMMTTYWIKTRPKHKRLMWLCHFLHRHIPSFRAIDFKDLLKEAIGYDLRNPYEQDLSSKNPVEHAMARLARLEGANEVVPIPGWIGPNGDRRLTFSREGGLFDGSVVRYLAITDGKTRGGEGFERTLAPEKPIVHGTGEVKEKDELESTSNVGSVLTVSEGMVLGEKTSQTMYTPRDYIFGYDDIEDSKLSPKVEAAHPSVAPESTEERYHAMIEEFNLDEANPDASQAGESDDTNTAVERQTDQANRSFHHVRPNLETFDSIADELQHATSSDLRSRERNMVVALSTCEYKRVLQIYTDTLTPNGLPASVRTLEIATEAALRLHFGNPTEAEALLARASKAGMNVTCAMGPLIVHRMRNMTHFRKRDANNLRMTVMDYYRMNDANGWPVSHHIATTAAHLLITNNCPEHGVNLLTAVYTSEWVTERPLDTVAMTVFLMGYNDLESLSGIKWIVDHVLSNNLRVSRSFMRELKRSYTRPEETPSKSWRVRTRFTDEQDRAVLRAWAEKCYQRRVDQIHEDHQLGSQLEATIKECARKQGLEVRTSAEERDVYQALVKGELEAGADSREQLGEAEDWVDGVSALYSGACVGDEEPDVDEVRSEKGGSDVATPYPPFVKDVEDAPTVARPVAEATDVDGRDEKIYTWGVEAPRTPSAHGGRSADEESAKASSYTPFV